MKAIRLAAIAFAVAFCAFTQVVCYSQAADETAWQSVPGGSFSTHNCHTSNGGDL
jgi:hypothetical protein